jgi:Bor protein
MNIRKIAPVAALVLSAACYHATIETGLQAGTQVIDQQWAMSFVEGLIPPPTVSTMSKCPSGVARVETQHSFLNLVVGAVTFGIITPMQITVTCAVSRAEAPAAKPDLFLRPGAPTAVAQDVFATAADRAVKNKAPVFVQTADSLPAPKAP